jgi:hypothetical protein
LKASLCFTTLNPVLGNVCLEKSDMPFLLTCKTTSGFPLAMDGPIRPRKVEKKKEILQMSVPQAV